jgi:hypothetical protein
MMPARDDGSATPAFHGSDRGARAVHHAVHVDAHDESVDVVGQRLDIGVADRDPGVEEGDVDTAELALDGPERGVHLTRLADVGAVEHSADGVGDSAAGVVGEVDDADPCAFRCHQFGRRPADP